MKYLCFALILICAFGIDCKWFEGVNLLIYEYGEVEDSRFFLPNLIKCYGNCSREVLIHELSHADRKEYNHNEFFWLTYYRIKYERT